MEMLNKSDDTEMIMQATFMLAKQRHLEFVTPELTLASLTTLEEVEHLFHVLNQDLKAFRKELLGYIDTLEKVPEGVDYQITHFFAVFRENRFHPRDYALKIVPKFYCVVVVLMFAHINLDANVAGNPTERSFEIVLTYGGTVEIFARQTVCRAIVFGEITFGIAHPTA